MAETPSFLVIEVQGTPYECGYQYGQAAAELIRNNIEAYLRIFQFHADLDRDLALQKAERFLPEIERYNADLLEEMRGIADGAEVSLNEVALLNTRTELMSDVTLHESSKADKTWWSLQPLAPFDPSASIDQFITARLAISAPSTTTGLSESSI